MPLLLVPHIVHQIGLGPFGSLAIALSAASFGTVVVQFAFQLTGPRQLALLGEGETHADVISRITSAKLLLLLGTLLLISVALGIGRLTGYPINGPETWLLFAIPVAGALHTGWYLQSEGRFIAVSMVAVCGAVLALVTGFGCVSGADATIMAALALSVAPIWTGMMTLWLSIRHVHRRDDTKSLGWRAPWAELRAGWPLFASQFTAALYGMSGTLVIGALAGAEEAGAFGVVERITGAVMGACLLTHTAAYPSLVRLYTTNKAGYRRLMSAVFAVYVVLVGALITAVVWTWDATLQFLLGAQGQAYGPLLVAALVWLSLGLWGPMFTGYLTASGRGQAALPLTLKILLVALALGIPGVIIWGAWAWLAALCASQAIVIAAAIRAWTE